MSQTIPFIKVNGCGNDFVLIDRSRLEPPQAERFETGLNAEFTRWVCDRRTGVGADGILLIDRQQEQWAARIINADGSDGGMCGNGLRCIALYLLRRGDASAREPIPLMMGGRVTELQIERAEPFRASLNLGCVQVGTVDGSAPVSAHALETLGASLGGMTLGVAWAGNPHAALMTQEIPTDALGAIAKRIRGSGLFPAGVNVTVAVPIDRAHLRATTDERGVGPTQACASGAASLVAIMHRAGLVDASCEVQMPGGSLSVQVTRDPQMENACLARIAGGAEIVFQGEIPISAPKSTA